MTFTLEQIHQAHAKVKSWADFPHFVKYIRELGVTKYDVYVVDGHTEYCGRDDLSISWPAQHPLYDIADVSDASVFADCLRAHQRGETDYLRFSQDAANAGVEKWIVDTDVMTCTYYDKEGKVILEEKIPQ